MWSHNNPADLARGTNPSRSQRVDAEDNLSNPSGDHKPQEHMLFKRPSSEEPDELHLRPWHPLDTPPQHPSAREGMFSQENRHAPQLAMGTQPPIAKDMFGGSQTSGVSEYYRSARSSFNMKQQIPASGRRSPQKGSFSRGSTSVAESPPGTPIGGGNGASPGATRMELPEGSSRPEEVTTYGGAPYHTGSPSTPLKFVMGDEIICPHEGCEQTFTRRNDLVRHLDSVHSDPHKKRSDDPSLCCSKCGVIFSRPDARRRHETSKACGKRSRRL